jgi:hypothetical protein
MRMKATGPFHSSETRTVKGGAEFEVHDALGKELEQRGVATRIGSDTPSETGAERVAVVGAQPKAEAELLNKMEPAPDNKRKRKQRIVSETGAETNAENEAEQEALLSRLDKEE